MDFLNNLNLNIPPDLINVANEISNQIGQNGLNIFPDGGNPQELMNNINNIQQNVQTGMEIMNKINELYSQFDHDADGAITQKGFIYKYYLIISTLLNNRFLNQRLYSSS